MLPEILFPGWFVFPEGTAGAQYVYGLGKALRAGGHSVGYVVDGSVGRDQDRVADGSYAFDGFPYYPLGIRKEPGRLRSLLASAGGPLELTLEWLRAQDLRRVRHIFTYSGSCAYLLKLRAFCRSRGLTLTNLVVEWYSPMQYALVPPRRRIQVLIDCELQRRVVNRLIANLVCISRYLHQHYSRLGCLSVIAPHLLDLDDAKWPKATEPRHDRPGLNLVSAGSGGKHDMVHNAIRGLALLADKGREVKFTICGPSRELVTRFLGPDRQILDRLRDQLDFRGALPHREALAEVARADFSILFRPEIRCTRAGLPTKLGESLACGTPILGNLTGDVGLYVTDGVEGILVPDCRPECFAQGLARALSMPTTARHAMRARARQRAAVSLDYRKYGPVMNEFLDRLRQRAKAP
jgi:glycosyltransferase involved in cell wall biosynthesis